MEEKQNQQRQLKRVLVTGGQGFIGTYVRAELRARGIEPVSFDHHGPTDFLGDVLNYYAVSEGVAITDGVIHLAGVLGTQETVKKPEPAVQTNILGSLNAFEACAHYQKPCVYIAVGNHTENNSYSITKTTAERFAFMFNKERGTEIAVVRALNAYGPGQKVGPVRKIMPNFIVPTLLGKPIEIYGDGEQRMDMIYVKDVATILVQALVTQLNPAYYRGWVFEAGTGKAPTVNTIAAVVRKVLYEVHNLSSPNPRHLPMRPGETHRSTVVGDPETLRPLFNGEVPPMLDLVDGVERAVAYYRQVTPIPQEVAHV